MDVLYPLQYSGGGVKTISTPTLSQVRQVLETIVGERELRPALGVPLFQWEKDFPPAIVARIKAAIAPFSDRPLTVEVLKLEEGTLFLRVVVGDLAEEIAISLTP